MHDTIARSRPGSSKLDYDFHSILRLKSSLLSLINPECVLGKCCVVQCAMAWGWDWGQGPLLTRPL